MVVYNLGDVNYFAKNTINLLNVLLSVQLIYSARDLNYFV